MAASMFSARLSPDVSPNSPLTRLVQGLSDIRHRLAKRQAVSAQEFENTLNLREKTHHLAPYKPTGDVRLLSPGTYYLEDVDNLYHRTYRKA